MLVLTCLDPRTDPAHILGLNLSDAIVIRNVGGRVTPEVINDVAFVAQLAENAIPDGPSSRSPSSTTPNAAPPPSPTTTSATAYAQRIAANESDLRDHAVLEPTASVASDVDRLRSAEAISSRVAISGYVYDIATGLVETVI